VSPSAVSNLNKKIYAKIEAWRNRRIEGEHPYLYLDGIVFMPRRAVTPPTAQSANDR
jgi:transposase-like protein